MAALRGLEPEEERYLDAINLALDDADLRGPEIRKFVQLHYWKGYTVPQSAIWINVSDRTAARMNGWICRKVASLIGLYTEKM